MSSPWHDSVKAIFTEHPELAVELAASRNGHPLTVGAVGHPTALTDKGGLSAGSDADVVIVVGPETDPVRAIMVAAAKRTYRDRPLRWAYQAAQLWADLRCPVDVLVICPDGKSAYFYARPVATSLRGFVLMPIVVPPSAIPAITNPEEAAANPAMAALSVAYHGTDPVVPEAVAAGYRQLPPDTAALYRARAYNLAPLAVTRILKLLEWGNA